jgi:hypothetical protein
MAKRTVVVKFWGADPPKEVGRVEYDGSGPANILGFDAATRADLAHGISDLSGGRDPEWRTPADGDKFLDAVLFEFRGGYTRAEEA